MQNDNYLLHYGMPRRSGRYPWGSGKNPFGHTGRKKGLFGKKKSKNEYKLLNDDEKKARVLSKRSALELYKYADFFNDAELRSAYNRLVLERDIKNLTPETITAGSKFIERADRMAKVFSSASNLLDNGAKAYNSIARIANASGFNTEVMPLVKFDNNNNNDNNNGNNKSKRSRRRK